jgi:hypothetical protein
MKRGKNSDTENTDDDDDQEDRRSDRRRSRSTTRLSQRHRRRLSWSSNSSSGVSPSPPRRKRSPSRCNFEGRRTHPSPSPPRSPAHSETSTTDGKMSKKELSDDSGEEQAESEGHTHPPLQTPVSPSQLREDLNINEEDVSEDDTADKHDSDTDIRRHWYQKEVFLN